MVGELSVVDEAWGHLADAPTEERESSMLSRYLELTALTDGERHVRLLQMARAEYALPDDKLRSMTQSRLNTLLNMDSDKASVVMAAYDGVMREMPADAAMKRVTLVQALSREMPAESEAKLRELVPTVFAGAPPRATGLEVEIPPIVRGSARRPWWAFWKGKA